MGFGSSPSPAEKYEASSLYFDLSKEIVDYDIDDELIKK